MQHTIEKTKINHTDFEVSAADAGTNESVLQHRAWHNIKYFIAGMIFGFVLMKSEVVSWYRIQEMFRLESFHMYGVIGSAIFTGMISILLIKKFNIKTIYGEPIHIPKRKFSKGQIYGGLIFGFGWALTGACPGPLYALIGGGLSVMSVALVSAIAGTWVYGWLQEKLPH